MKNLITSTSILAAMQLYNIAMDCFQKYKHWNNCCELTNQNDEQMMRLSENLSENIFTDNSDLIVNM